MGSLAGCMAIINGLTSRDADGIVEAVDRYLAAGLSPADAQRSAALDFMAEVEADEAEARAAIREQHPDLFRAPAPAAPNKPRVFTDTSSRSAPAGAAPTYISRPVSNAGDLHAWAEAAGLSDLVAPQDMHVTIVYSREPFDAGQLPAAEASMLVSGGKRTIDVLGDEKAVVLRFDSPQLQQRWQQTRDAGASWQRINDDRHRYGRLNALAADPLEFGVVYLAPEGRAFFAPLLGMAILKKPVATSAEPEKYPEPVVSPPGYRSN